MPIYEPVMLTFGGKAVRNVSTLNGTLFTIVQRKARNI